MQTNPLAEVCEVNLAQMLKAREDRAAKQRELLQKYQHNLICFTINMPGSKKRTAVTEKVFSTGYQVLIASLDEQEIPVLHTETNTPCTGPEAYIVTSEDTHTVKKLLIELEDRHQLGRLFDFDVMGPNTIPISREALGETPRRCLLCGQKAHICSSNRSHSLQELSMKINEIVSSYFNGSRPQHTITTSGMRETIG